MKKVLIIANQFPPMGGSGIQRTSKFVKYLHLYGYEPVVLTREVSASVLRDETLLKDIPDGTTIVRTKAYDFSQGQGMMRIPGKVVAKYLLIPDGDRVWAECTKKKALALIKEHNINVVYTTSSPYSDHLIGLYIKQKMPTIKWVADFRDEWTNNPYTLDHPHNWVRTNIEKKMEQAVLQQADVLVTNTPVMRQNFIDKSNSRADNFYVISNGYDEEDFTAYKMQPKQQKREQLQLTYTGLLYGRRKPDTFFEALGSLIKEKQIDGTKICVSLIGNYHEKELQQKIDSYDLTKQVTIVGYLPHDECVKRQMDADILVLIEGTGVGAEAFYTGKLFEYMNTGKPVLACIPEAGAAAGLVRKTNIGKVSHTDSVDQIKTNLLAYYKEWQSGVIQYAPDSAEIKRYERKELTRQLAELF